MNIPALLLAFFFCITLSTTAAPPTSMRIAVDAFLNKPRVVDKDPFGGPALDYKIQDKPTSDKDRRSLEFVIVRDAAKLSAELATLAEQATPEDSHLVGQLQRARLALDAVKTDKAKVAEALRQLAALKS
jgi:hypothetical protein